MTDFWVRELSDCADLYCYRHAKKQQEFDKNSWYYIVWEPLESGAGVKLSEEQQQSGCVVCGEMSAFLAS